MSLDLTKRPVLLQEPISSYDFLTTRMVEVIREEPARMRMGLVALTTVDGDNDDDFIADIISEECLSEYHHVPVPSCGAVGCIAGWTDMLMRGYFSSGKLVFPARILGIDEGKTEILCAHEESRGMATELFCPNDLMSTADEGTPEYAERVIQYILKFCSKYETVLKARIIDPKKWR